MRRMKKVIVCLSAVVFAAVMLCVMSVTAYASNEVWTVHSDTTLNLRETAAISSTILTRIPANTKITVTSKAADSSYVWGKVTYSGYTGWCALNYANYVSGNISVPSISNTASVYDKSIKLTWSSAKSASSYTLKVYKSGTATVVASYTTSSLSKTLSLSPGKYYAIVTAKNNLVPNWSASGSAFSFTVVNTTDVNSIVLSTSSLTLTKDSWYTVNATVSPSTALNKEVRWTSSDTSVITVSSSGVVTAVNYGIATVKCTATDGSGVSASLTVNVTCKQASAPYQVQSSSNNTTSSVYLTWGKLKDADAYIVYKYYSSTKQYVVYKTTTSNNCTVTGLSAGTTYSFKVKGFVKAPSGYTYGKISNSCLATTLPKTPSSLTVTGLTVSSVSFKWSACNGAGYYIVYKYDSSAGGYVRIATTTVPSYKASTSLGELCYFKVRALKKLGTANWQSGLSETIAVSPLPATPSLTVAKSGTSAILSWSSVAGATGYEVYYATSPNGPYTLLSISTDGVQSLTKSGLTKGMTYFFRLRAYNTTNNITGYSKYSAQKSITI